MFSTLIIFLLVLCLLVFVHEFGHFIAAKKSGVAVEEFGFGFPPRIVGVERGGTIYSLNWIPLGGFVKIKGEAGESRHDKDSYAGKSAWRRAIILFAGVVMNVLLAWALLSVGYMIGLPEALDGLPASARVSDEKIQVMSVLKDSPAAAADVEDGDVIVSFDGIAPDSIDAVREYMSRRLHTPVTLALLRVGEAITRTVSPDMIAETGRAGIGVALARTGLVSYPPYVAPIEAAKTTWEIVRQIALSFYFLLQGLIVHRAVTVELSGPVGIAVLTAQVARLGFRYLVQFTALLSVNLAIINVLPIPALDGGRLLFLAIERVRGRPVDRKTEALVHTIGFAALMTLVLVITYGDVVRFGDKILQTFGKLFG